MNKLFKLIWVNLLSLFDINKIIVAREDGVKSNLENRAIITGIVIIVYAILGYSLLTSLPIVDKYKILSIGFIISTLLCFVINLFVIEPLIFKNNDNDILFSFPVSRQQILFSKLFTVYLRNILFVAIIMGASFFSFYKFVPDVGETQVLMYILITLVIPFIPIILATVIAYGNDYFKLKYNSDIRYKGFILGVMLIIVGIFMLVFNGISIDSVDQGVTLIIDRLNYIYPFINVFYIAIRNESMLCFLSILLCSILLIWLYSMFISNNYLKICSMLKGVKKKDSFQYKKVSNLHRVFGIVRKELLTLKNNKTYFSSAFGPSILGSLLILIILNIVNVDKIMEIKYMDLYIKVYLPVLLAMFACLGNSAISSMSLEKDGMQILCSMPINMGKVMLGKWLTNVLIGSIFIIINTIIVSIYLPINKWGIFFSIVVPLFALMFVSLSSILLDYRFIEKNENNDNAIIKQRLITMIPSFLSIVIGVSVFLFPLYKKYKMLLGSYVLLFILLMIIEVIYLFINRERLLRNLFN